MGYNDDATNKMMQDMQTANDISTHFLTAHGYNGEAFKATVNKVKKVGVTAKWILPRPKPLISGHFRMHFY